MQATQQLEQDVLDFVQKVRKQYRLAVTIRKGDEHFGKGVCTVCLRRGDREETIILSRDDIALGGRRRQTAQRIKEVAEKLGGGALG